MRPVASESGGPGRGPARRQSKLSARRAKEAKRAAEAKREAEATDGAIARRLREDEVKRDAEDFALAQQLQDMLGLEERDRQIAADIELKEQVQAQRLQLDRDHAMALRMQEEERARTSTSMEVDEGRDPPPRRPSDWPMVPDPATGRMVPFEYPTIGPSIEPEVAGPSAGGAVLPRRMRTIHQDLRQHFRRMGAPRELFENLARLEANLGRRLGGAAGGEVDPDNMDYDALLRLGEAIGPAVPSGASSRQINDNTVTSKYQRPRAKRDAKADAKASGRAGPAGPAGGAQAPQPSGAREGKTEEKAETCVICLEEFKDGEEIRRLPCLHIFHQGCVDRALQIKSECPICRNPINGGGSS